jgi:hypothetical protein
MKRLLLALTLACVLSGTALAGEMPTVEPAPAAPTSSGTQSSVVVTVLLTIISIVG